MARPILTTDKPPAHPPADIPSVNHLTRRAVRLTYACLSRRAREATMQTEHPIETGTALERMRLPTPLGISIVIVMVDVIATTLSIWGF